MISKKTVVLLFVSFFSYGVVTLVLMIVFIVPADVVYFEVSITIDQFTFILSGVTLAIVLSNLISLQAAQKADYSSNDETLVQNGNYEMQSSGDFN